MKNLLFYALLLVTVFACSNDDKTDPPSTNEKDYEGYTLVWNDEFDTNEINNLNWTYELGDGTDYGLAPGWGNSELQLYTNAAANAYIETVSETENALVIQANEEANGSYSSAKLTTQNLKSFRYGRIEANIKLPKGQGIWPAFWMLGDNITEISWPGCGEIDIMELIGHTPNVIHGSLHFTDGENSKDSFTEEKELSTGDFSEDYHLFRIDWTSEEIIFSLDEVPYYTAPIRDDMKEFQRSAYMILNIAVGGNWPGNPDATTVFPQKMYIDWIRYYSKDDFTAPAAPALDIAEETIGSNAPPGVAQYAFRSGLDQFSGIGLVSYGGGGEPDIMTSDIVLEGDSSLLFSYPGGNWGGGWFELEDGIDMSAYANGNLVFSLQKPAALDNVEIKLEAVGNSAMVFLKDYSPVAAANDYVTYTIPMADFVDLDFTAIKIPFALWNPMDVNGEFPVLDVLVDDIYWEE